MGLFLEEEMLAWPMKREGASATDHWRYLIGKSNPRSSDPVRKREEICGLESASGHPHSPMIDSFISE